MLKIFLHIFFVIAAVAGDGKPQDYGQDQLPFSSSPLQIQRQALSPVIPLQSIYRPHAIPCRRRNFGDSSPDSSSVQVPLPYNQQIYNRDPLIGNQPTQSQLKPQSLTENKAPAIDIDERETEKNGRNSESPNESVELVEKTSIPDQVLQNYHPSDSENRKSILDPVFNNNFIETSNVNQNNEAIWQPKSVSQHTSNYKVKLPEKSPECEGNEDVEQNLIHDDSGHSAESIGKESPDRFHELVSKCVQEARSAQEDFEGVSRRAMSNNLPSSQPNNAKTESLLKPEPVDNKSDLVQDVDKVAYLENPAKNAGKWGPDSHISLLEHGRVCYACSSYFDPSCWNPNATTTVKYCSKGNNACLTKTLKVGGKAILIRDCGQTCNEADPYGVVPKIESCTMCLADMCNSAYNIHGINVLLALVIAASKYTL